MPAIDTAKAEFSPSEINELCRLMISDKRFPQLVDDLERSGHLRRTNFRAAVDSRLSREIERIFSNVPVNLA